MPRLLFRLRFFFYAGLLFPNCRALTLLQSLSCIFYSWNSFTAMPELHFLSFQLLPSFLPFLFPPFLTFLQFFFIISTSFRWHTCAILYSSSNYFLLSFHVLAAFIIKISFVNTVALFFATTIPRSLRNGLLKFLLPTRIVVTGRNFPQFQYWNETDSLLHRRYEIPE